MAGKAMQRSQHLRCGKGKFASVQGRALFDQKNQFSPKFPPQHPPIGLQHDEPGLHEGPALAYDELFFEIAPAPPLIRRFTVLPQLGHSVMG